MPNTTDVGTIHPEALKAARKRRGMSQEQLACAVHLATAARLSISRSAARRYARGG